MPKVSVLVPIYGVERYIERCARSLFCQELEDMEYIFIDDCSPDKSMDILGRIIEEFRSCIIEKNWIVRTERMQTNCGQAAIRKYGIQLATGDYILYCDSDDWIEKDMILDMWNLAEKDDLDVVVCDYSLVKKNETIRCIGSSNCDATAYLKDVLSAKFSWALWNKLFKRSLFNNEMILPSDGMNMGEDMVLVIQLLYYCKTMGYIPKAYYNYCENPESITQSSNIDKIVGGYVQCVANVSVLESFFCDKEDCMVTKEDIKKLFQITNCVRIRFDVVNRGRLMYIYKLILNTCFCPFISIMGKYSMIRYLLYRIVSSVKSGYMRSFAN